MTKNLNHLIAVPLVPKFLIIVFIASMCSAQAQSRLTFLPAVNYPTTPLNLAWAVAVGDLNNDSKPDLAVVDFGVDVTVLLGNGDGTFQSGAVYTGGFSAVTIADINGDGKADLLVDGGEGAFVGILLGNGNGTFQPIVPYFTGGNGGVGANSLAVADVNADSKPDILLARGFPAAVSVLLGKGDGTFNPAVSYFSGGNYAASVAIADVNNDNKLDLLVAGSNSQIEKDHGTVGVLLGEGDGTFQQVVTYSTASSLASVVAADINNDGRPDAIVADYTSSVGILLGNGDGTLQPVVVLFTAGPRSVTVADVNADSKLDVLAANDSHNSAGVLLGNGDGTFQTEVNYDAAFGSSCVVSADLNGDGKPDMIVAGGKVSVYLNNNGAPSTTNSLTSSVNPATLKKAVTFTAMVSSQLGGALGGTVTFKDRAVVLSTVPLSNNQASFTMAFKSPSALGSHLITARYSGVLYEAAGSQSNTLTETVRAPSITKVTTSGSPSNVGQAVTFTATVTSVNGPIPNGDLVIFSDGAKQLATVPLSGGIATFTTSILTAKKHNIKVTYVGDNTFASSKAQVVQIVQ